MSVYIKGIGIISAQRTLDKSIFVEGALPFSGNRLHCIEPNYADFIDSKQIRRMSRVIKMGVACSITALKEAGIEKPESVIVGTAYGCLDDTDSFLKKLVQNKEEMLNPTPFIHSTHNTIASQIALVFKCQGYNSTYVHRNISFESALIDATLLLEEKTVKNVLVGGIDETNESSFTILDRLGNFKKKEEVNNKNLYTSNSKGSVSGEGSAFFVLVDKPDNTCYAALRATETISFCATEQVADNAKALLTRNGIEKADLLICANNGDLQDDKIADTFSSLIGMENHTLKFKHLSGEYPTSTAFAMWMGAEIIKSGKIDSAFSDSPAEKKIQHVVIHNQNKNLHHSLILLSAC